MKIIDGLKVSDFIKKQIINEVNTFAKRPKVVDIQIGFNAASEIYISRKEKVAKEVGIDFECIRFDATTSEDVIIKKIDELNNNSNINGIFIQSPIPKKYDEIKIMNTVKPEKDVDGLTYINAGRLLNNKKSLISCTPNGIMELLKYYKLDILGKNVCIVGRSSLVGKPLLNLFLNENATVTICHSFTKDLEKITKKADILIVAIGKKHFITSTYIKKDSRVIDVGINRYDNKIYGDVNFDDVKTKVKYITPVPGGVGPMTVIMLLKNVIIAYKNQNNIY